MAQRWLIYPESNLAFCFQDMGKRIHNMARSVVKVDYLHVGLSWLTFYAVVSIPTIPNVDHVFSGAPWPHGQHFKKMGLPRLLERPLSLP